VPPILVKKSDEDGWFPDDPILVFVAHPPGSPSEVTIPVPPGAIPGINATIEDAKKAGESFPPCPYPLPIEEVDATIREFEKVRRASHAPAPDVTVDAPRSRRTRTLLIKGAVLRTYGDGEYRRS
jgi:hypothetical protein